LGCSKVAAQENVIARFAPLQAGESLEYSLIEYKFTLTRKGVSGSYETVYRNEKVRGVQRIGENLLLTVDPAGSYRGYVVILIVGTAGEIRDVGKDIGRALFNDYVLFLRYQGLDAPDYPIIEVYSIKENKILYSISLTKYAQDCLWEEWRQQITVQIFNEAKINYARIAFLAEESSAMDVYLDISAKEIKAICNWNK
jgi:hypothetical protein